MIKRITFVLLACLGVASAYLLVTSNQASSSGGSCRYEQTYDHFRRNRYNNIPVYYINLDNAVHRKEAFLSMFGCLDPVRIPGVNASNPAVLKRYLSLGLTTVPGVAEHDLGEPEWNGIDRKCHTRTHCWLCRASTPHTHLLVIVNMYIVL